MTDFHSGQAAAVVHSNLKSALSTMEKAKQNAILWFGEIRDRRLFRELGYSTIGQYAEKELGWGKSKTYDFLSICEKLDKLPKVKAKVASGELGYTNAREMLKVTDSTNEDLWLDVALNNPRRELAREVKRAQKEAADERTGQSSLIPDTHERPKAVVPTQVAVKMSPTQLARYEALWVQLRKCTGVSSDRAEALLEMMASYLQENSTRVENSHAPPVQIHVHQCPDCEKTTVQTNRGELDLGEAEVEKAQCDALVSSNGQRNKSSIPPRIRREVLARARHRCQRPGCKHTGYLEVHHRVPRSRGGTNDPANLICLCSACHQLVHENKDALARLHPVY